MPKLSIITINYNNRDGLERTIRSVVGQTFKDFEYIVIDGGSTDGSVDIIKKYSDRIDYWVSEPDKGIYNAMNKGVSKATGDYCNFLNSGDYFNRNDVLDRLNFNGFAGDILVGVTQYFHCEGDALVFEHLDYPPQKITAKRMIFSSIGHQSSIIKTSLLRRNMYDETLKIVGDWKFFFQSLILHNCQYDITDIVISNFDSTGCSNTNRKVMMEERKSVLSELLPPRILSDYVSMQYGETELEKILVHANKKGLFYRTLTYYAKVVHWLSVVR